MAIIVMCGLGAFITREYRALRLQSHGKLGSVYIDNLLAPYALASAGGVAEVSPHMDQALSNLAKDSSSLLLRIWRLDGTLSYSSYASDAVDLHDGEDLDEALAGNFVTKLETSGVVDAGFPLPYPYFEVYAPIHDPATGEMIAVGEVYLDASEILQDQIFTDRTVWAALTFATLGVLGMLALSFSQSAQLQCRLKAERRMTEQNRRLRRAADQARLESAQANEQILNMVGAELHDGPVQILGLMSLMDEGAAHSRLADGTTRGSLIERVMTELRTMSAGLILPELDDLDVGGVVALAVERHRALTGAQVDLDMHLSDVTLDTPRKICLYRVVQEALMNAGRHGNGGVPCVSLKTSGTTLEISVRGGVSTSPEAAEAVPQMPAWRLGLQGMRRRLEAFGGTLVLHKAADETHLQVTLPLNTPFAADGDDVS